MTRTVDFWLRCPVALDDADGRRRGEASALVDGKFAWGPFLGMTYDNACLYDRDVQRACAVHKEDLVREEAYYDLSSGRTLLERFEMWAWGRTKQYGTIKLRANFAQQDLLERMQAAKDNDQPFLEWIVKCRQWGMSTTIQLAIQYLSAEMEDVNALTMAHKRTKTKEIWRIQQDSWNRMCYRPRVKFVESRDRMEFVRSNTRQKIESAEDKNPSRSDTNLIVHQSESAMYPKPEEIDDGVSATLPERGFRIWIKESTAKGVGNHFHKGYELAENGESEFRATFYGWLEHPEYWREVYPEERGKYAIENLDPDDRDLVALGATPERLKWWNLLVATRFAGDKARARQEFPATALEAFQGSGASAFATSGLMKIRRWIKNEAPIFEGQLEELDVQGDLLTRDPLHLQ